MWRKLHSHHYGVMMDYQPWEPFVYQMDDGSFVVLSQWDYMYYEVDNSTDGYEVKGHALEPYLFSLN